MNEQENQEQQQELTSILRKYFDTHGNVQFAFLFGSRAKNKTRFMSDIDIAVYFSDIPEILEFGVMVSDLESLLDIQIDLVMLNDLHKKDPRLAYNIIGEGLLVFCRNNDLLTNFKSSVFLEYLDIRPMLQISHNKFLSRLNNNRFAVRIDSFGKR